MVLMYHRDLTEEGISKHVWQGADSVLGSPGGIDIFGF